jgi:hypothetical protein
LGLGTGLDDVHKDKLFSLLILETSIPPSSSLEKEVNVELVKKKIRLKIQNAHGGILQPIAFQFHIPKIFPPDLGCMIDILTEAALRFLQSS